MGMLKLVSTYTGGIAKGGIHIICIYLNCTKCLVRQDVCSDSAYPKLRATNPRLQPE